MGKIAKLSWIFFISKTKFFYQKSKSVISKPKIIDYFYECITAVLNDYSEYSQGSFSPKNTFSFVPHLDNSFYEQNELGNSSSRTSLPGINVDIKGYCLHIDDQIRELGVYFFRLVTGHRGYS